MPTYSGEFKQKVVADLREHRLSYSEAMRKYGIAGAMTIQKWERIYLEEGPEGLYRERRGQANGTSGVRKGRKPKPGKTAGNGLLAENERLRAEVAYLKKLHALVLEEERRSKRRG
jgi:transposase